MADAARLRNFPALTETLSRSWWLVLLRGLAAVGFAFATLAWPGLTLLTLVLLFGGYALMDGAAAIFAALAGGGAARRWWLALAGALSVAAGVFAITRPGIGLLAAGLAIGWWAIARGVSEVAGAIVFRRASPADWALALGGLVSILFGVLVVTRPGFSLIALVWIIACWAMAFGAMTITWSLRLRRLGR